ncbi:MAG: ferric reductase-like transmembrane domain-containing protein [Beijerinckiaceae bacterium]|nr:ferric reductase-like transmembrane domain-containing protein [Beijerinckiaceae bacterium]
MLPWTDRAGRLSWLKLAVFISTLLPFAYLAWRWEVNDLGSKPITEAIHRSGDWSVRFLLLSLAVSPLRRIANWPRLILVRRMLGLAALGYLLLHFVLYNVDQHWNLAKVASEIVLRVYLTIGFVALLGMLALGLTSFDGAIRRLGSERWNRLHFLTYPIAILSVLHFAMQSKLDASEALLMSGYLLYLLLYRVMNRASLPTNAWTLLGMALGASVLTAIMEASWYGFTRNIDPLLILPANFDFDIGVRPAWYVLGAGLGVVLLAALRPHLALPQKRAGQGPAHKISTV